MIVLIRFVINITCFLNGFDFLLLFASIIMIAVMTIIVVFYVVILTLNMAKVLKIKNIYTRYSISD